MVGTQKQKGLVDEDSKERFESRLEEIKHVWVQRHSSGIDFYDYFVKEKAPKIIDHMLANVRTLAGLGIPPISYTQNGYEALNSAFLNEI